MVVEDRDDPLGGEAADVIEVDAGDEGAFDVVDAVDPRISRSMRPGRLRRGGGTERAAGIAEEIEVERGMGGGGAACGNGRRGRGGRRLRHYK